MFKYDTPIHGGKQFAGFLPDQFVVPSVVLDGAGDVIEPTEIMRLYDAPVGDVQSVKNVQHLQPPFERPSDGFTRFVVAC